MINMTVFEETSKYKTKEYFKEYALAVYESIVENGWVKELDYYYKNK